MDFGIYICATFLLNLPLHGVNWAGLSSVLKEEPASTGLLTLELILRVQP